MTDQNTSSNENIHPAYDIFMLWHEDQRKKQLEDFLCWREIQIAKEENDTENQLEQWKESYGMMTPVNFDAFFSRNALSRQKQEANWIKKCMIMRRLRKQDRESWRDYDHSHIPSLYDAICEWS